MEISRRTVALCIGGAMAWLSLVACRSQERAPVPEEHNSAADTLLPPAATSVAVPETLRYRVQPRQWYEYWMTRVDTVVYDSLQQTSRIWQYYTKTVRRVYPDGRIELGVRIDTLAAMFVTPDSLGAPQRISYDSRRREDRQNPNFTHLNALLGAEVRMLVSPLGQIDSIYGLEPIIRRLMRGVADSIPPQLMAALSQRIEEQIYRPLQQEYLAFPSGRIDTSRSWAESYPDALASIFPTRNTARYVIVGEQLLEGRRALEIAAQLRTEVLQRRQQEGALRAELRNERLSGGGNILVDAQEGYTVRKSLRLRMQFEVVLQDTARASTENFRQATATHVEFGLARRGWSSK
jgi:hypothetical protein